MTRTTHRPDSMRDDIAHHVALFRERQRRFNEARETYSAQMLARARADLERIGARPALKPETDRSSGAAASGFRAPGHG